LNKNNETELNAAFTQGLIGLAAVFYVLSDVISDINKNVVIFLVILFVVLSLIRVFGIILNIEMFKNLSVDIFSIIGLPSTVYVALRIIITQIYPNSFMIFVFPFYAFVVLLILMIIRQFELEIKIHIRKKRRK